MKARSFVKRLKKGKPWIFTINTEKSNAFRTGIRFPLKVFVKIKGKRYWINHYFSIGQNIAWHFTDGKKIFSYDLRQLFKTI